MKTEKISDSKRYVRKIKSMGEGLVLFEISVAEKRIGQNYHLFYEDKRKPPLDIAINPCDGTIEYISYFAQDEVIENKSINKEIVNKDIGVSIINMGLNEENVNITTEGKFVFIKLGNDIWILREDVEEPLLNAYKINELNSLLFSDDKFCGVILKNLNKEEIQEIQNSKCLL